LSEKIHQRVSNCTDEARNKFLGEATRLNDAFQDNFRLALITPKISLASVIGELQKTSRDIKALDADGCGEMVKEHMGKSYDLLIKDLMDFMSDESGVDKINTARMEAATEMYEFEAYKIDVAAPLVVKDFRQFQELQEQKIENIPADLQYFESLRQHKMSCTDVAYIEPILYAVIFGAMDRFTDLMGASENALPTETRTPIPCVP
jgi:hypothetical protein